MPTITLNYSSSGANYTRNYSVLAIRGADWPDAVRLYPGVFHEYLDGGLEDQFKGFGRIITISFGVITEKAAATFLLYWLLNSNRSIVTPDGETINVAFRQDSFENNWIDDFEFGKDYEVTVYENSIRTTFPSVIVAASGTNTVYIKLKVAVTGTMASPETFTTNAGKLATRENGDAYPTILLSTWVAMVQLNSYQECEIKQIGDVTQSGNNITFTLAQSDAGAASGDGYYYCDIGIQLESRA